MKSTILHERRRLGSIVGLDGVSRGCSGLQLYAPDSAEPTCGPALPAPQLCPINNSYFYDAFDDISYSGRYWSIGTPASILPGGFLGVPDANQAFAMPWTNFRTGNVTGTGDFTIFSTVYYRADAGAAALQHSASMGLSLTDSVPSLVVNKQNLTTISFDYFNNGLVTESVAYIAGTTQGFNLKYQRVSGTLNAYRDGVLKGSMALVGNYPITLGTLTYMSGADYLLQGKFGAFWFYRDSAGLPGTCAGV